MLFLVMVYPLFKPCRSRAVAVRLLREMRGPADSGGNVMSGGLWVQGTVMPRSNLTSNASKVLIEASNKSGDK
jgi:hypothetical protein